MLCARRLGLSRVCPRFLASPASSRAVDASSSRFIAPFTTTSTSESPVVIPKQQPRSAAASTPPKVFPPEFQDAANFPLLPTFQPIREALFADRPGDYFRFNEHKVRLTQSLFEQSQLTRAKAKHAK